MRGQTLVVCMQVDLLRSAIRKDASDLGYEANVDPIPLELLALHCPWIKLEFHLLQAILRCLNLLFGHVVRGAALLHNLRKESETRCTVSFSCRQSVPSGRSRKPE